MKVRAAQRFSKFCGAMLSGHGFGHWAWVACAFLCVSATRADRGPIQIVYSDMQISSSAALRLEDGAFWFAWSEGESISMQYYLRKFSAEGIPLGEPIDLAYGWTLIGLRLHADEAGNVLVTGSNLSACRITPRRRSEEPFPPRGFPFGVGSISPRRTPWSGASPFSRLRSPQRVAGQLPGPWRSFLLPAL